MLWEKPGDGNTRQTLELAVQRAGQLGINNIAVSYTHLDVYKRQGLTWIPL